VRSAYIGIDVAIAKGKHLPIAVCTWDGDRLIPERIRHLDLEPPIGFGNAAAIRPESIRRFTQESVQYVSEVCQRLQLTPTRIGIDAPSAPCGMATRRREAETALDRAGISCFGTPSVEEFELIREKVKRHLASGGREDRIPHANQLWMLAGFALFREFSRLAPCLEVFPQATIRAVGRGHVHKSRPGAVEDQLNAVARYSGWTPGRNGEPALQEIAWGAPHDQLDAYLSAWVASLEAQDRVCYGVPPHDAIWVPRLTRPPAVPSETSITVKPPPLCPAKPAHVVLCPGCGQKAFLRWPWGWDSHAAHACAGLTDTDPEGRKEEFRRRFADYFRPYRSR
jgi:hypothetical protein